MYFNESAEAAQGIVDQVLSKYQALLAKLDEDSKGKVQRFMGLKMEQLKVNDQCTQSKLLALALFDMLYLHCNLLSPHFWVILLSLCVIFHFNGCTPNISLFYHVH